jgi:hypothetical protein
MIKFLPLVTLTYSTQFCPLSVSLFGAESDITGAVQEGGWICILQLLATVYWAHDINRYDEIICS